MLSRGMSSLTVPSAQSSQTLDLDALLGGRMECGGMTWGIGGDFDMQWICRTWEIDDLSQLCDSRRLQHE